MGENNFQDKILPWLKRAFSGEMVHYREIIDIPPYGWRTADISLYPMMDGGGKVIGVILELKPFSGNLS
jgi:hypothetical protein